MKYPRIILSVAVIVATLILAGCHGRADEPAAPIGQVQVGNEVYPVLPKNGLQTFSSKPKLQENIALDYCSRVHVSTFVDQSPVALKCQSQPVCQTSVGNYSPIKYGGNKDDCYLPSGSKIISAGDRSGITINAHIQDSVTILTSGSDSDIRVNGHVSNNAILEASGKNSFVIINPPYVNPEPKPEPEIKDAAKFMVPVTESLVCVCWYEHNENGPPHCLKKCNCPGVDPGVDYKWWIGQGDNSNFTGYGKWSIFSDGRSHGYYSPIDQTVILKGANSRLAYITEMFDSRNLSIAHGVTSRIIINGVEWIDNFIQPSPSLSIIARNEDAVVLENGVLQNPHKVITHGTDLKCPKLRPGRFFE